MQVNRMELGIYATNCYIVSGNTPGRCVLIDPADRGDRVIDMMESLGVQPEAVLLTHGHYDHILAVPALQKRYPGLPVYCHAADCPKELVEYDMGKEFPTVSAFDNLHHITNGQSLSFAGFTFEVICTPGHTPGSVTFQVEDALFTGDTLFCGDIGRTDFEGGSYPQIMQSLRILAALDGNFKVYPGHDTATELDRERRFNPYMKTAQRS